MSVKSSQKFLIIEGTNLSTGSGKNYLWWLNGTNRGTQVSPTRTYTYDDGNVLIAWDITKSGLNENCKTNPWTLNGTTIFGLTSTTGTSEIRYIGFVDNIDVLTGIEVLDVAVPSTDDEKVFDLSGRKAVDGRGIVIKGGRKIVR